MGLRLSHSVVPAPALTVWVTVAATVFAWTVVRCLRLGLVVSSDGLVVRNPIRSYPLEWTHVIRFADGQIRLMQSQWQSETRWALLINTSVRGAVQTWVLKPDPNSWDLLSRLAAAHGIPVLAKPLAT